ncbi:hypothetical protein L6452_19747 [Arctium lappa]|uniref:Uncharacterized protein n=1 Tax=Arctium lappa TaxID=4217 RepID=A0ACB9B8X2_ARCLA|nr:hypothetical protein L6452_19747 [Arctium lappa]
MGFFSPGTSNNQYVGIWYNQIDISSQGGLGCSHRDSIERYIRINEAYGSLDYQSVVLIDRPVARYKKFAYSLVDCCIVNAVPLAPSIFDFGDKFNRKSCSD